MLYQSAPTESSIFTYGYHPMKEPFLNCRTSINCPKLLLIAVLSLISIGIGCGLLQSKPSQTVESFLRTVERGDVKQAMTFLSSGAISRHGIEQLKRELSSVTVELKEHGGIKSIKVLKEDTVGDVAEVTTVITRGNGLSASVHYKLLKEQGTWKIDDAKSDSSVEADESEPLRPESAVEDVVKWVRLQHAAQLRSWLMTQPAPSVCTAISTGQAPLPDEVRYHIVDDLKIKARLLEGLDPVLKLTGCSSQQGVLLYKGLTVYAFNLGNGQIAITPDASYFSPDPPDEKIFHTLAELRIFLAREVFRQIVPAENPIAGLNEADMRLRQELKLDYLAALTSLVIDRDPAILDKAALDLYLFGKPPGIAPGTQGTPTLQQIQDVFGAARQDYQE
jgi:hypothetical protein